MKSRRVKIVALTSLQGGHQTAPQYRKSGLFSLLARANAASTSPVSHAMACSACGAAAATVSGVGSAALGGGSDVFEQATRRSAGTSGEQSRMAFLPSRIGGRGGTRS